MANYKWFWRCRAFTLVEMLVAMTITLIMMAAIAKSFAFVGERVRDSRAGLTLAAELLDVTTRMRNELERCTVSLVPNQGGPDQAGYFEYYEGPVTDATSSLFRVQGTAALPTLPDSRYGDFDDYIAFTAVAPPDSWFTGKVPRYLLDQRATGASYVLPSGPYDEDPLTALPFDPFAPVVIRSKYAEIIYFASPEYIPSSLPVDPTYIDVDADANTGSLPAGENGLPDRLRLHRRVLLIRPDLNINDALPIQIKGTLHFMRPDSWSVGTTTGPTATVPTVPTVPVAPDPADAWLYGMAGVHQQCDLSLRRVLKSDGTPDTLVAANSLEDLSKPHNRFAHVRVPFNVMSGAGSVATPTSMPILALGKPATILNLTNGTTRIAPDNSGTGPVVTPTRLCGFLRPEFVLGNDLNHFENLNDTWGLERLGEDLLVNNVIGFDVRIYDPGAVQLTTATNSMVVGPSDAGYREALTTAVASTASVTASVQRGEIQGTYVDLAYPVLAGGSLRGWQPRLFDRLSSATTAITFANTTTFNDYLVTPYSGLASAQASLATNANVAFSNSLCRSGRIVTSSANNIVLFQPAFDTYTSAYEHDGFLQKRTNISSEGTTWEITTGVNADLGSNGLDEVGIYSGGGPLSPTGQFGADDLGEHETLPPFLDSPASVQITIRVENPTTRQIRQSSVVHLSQR